MKRVVGFLCLAAAALALFAAHPGSQPRPAVPLPGLAALFDPARGATRDTNGDGIPDSVTGRVIVPAQPSTEDVQAAATIAARLGHETMALTLPIVLRDAEVEGASGIDLPILVGRENRFVKALVERGDVDLTALAPGQGLVAVVRSPLGGADGIVAVGGDAAGTLNAAMELGARLPRLWSMAGVAIAGVEEQIQRHLAAKGLAGHAGTLVSVVVDSDRRGLLRATVRVPATRVNAPRIVGAFEALDLAHRRGLEPRVLNFANVAATRIEVVVAGTVAGQVDVRRSGFNPRTLTPPLDTEEEAAVERQRVARAAAEAVKAPGTAGGKAAATETKPPGQAVPPAGAATAAGTPPAAGTAPPARGATPPGTAAPAGTRAGPPAPAKTFDLSNAYSIDGWFGDAYTDLIPDRTETVLVVPQGDEGLGAAHIAARLGLETTGLTFPIVKADDKVRDATRESNPILVGRTNKLVQQLDKIGKTRLGDLRPGEGVVHVVPRAFGQVTATVVAGADAPGTEAASLYLARRAPYLWDTTRGAPSLQDLAASLTRFFQARDGAGQVAMLANELKPILEEMKGKAVESIDVKLLVDQIDPKLDGFFEQRIAAIVKGATITTSSQRMTEPVPVFEETIDIPWEVDEFRATLDTAVLTKVKAGSKVDLELRVSESPEMRRQIANEARSALVKAGAANPRVRVLSAYKQGFLWLTEEVIPALRGKGVRSVAIKVAEYQPDLSKKFRFYQVPTRWVHELYPVDEIFQRELDLQPAAFTIELVEKPKEIYEIEARDRAGRLVHRAAFSPKFVEREYLDKFPGWSRVDVTTGWLTAAVDDETVVDARIKTDPERFWDYYQEKVLGRIHDNVMKLTGGRPTPDKQPFHRDLDVEIWMSEPDFRIGVDEDQISSLEALHEDIYFVTLDFYGALGRTTVQQRLASPGKILPIIHPERRGKPGQARVLYAANASSRPKLEVSYTEKGQEKPVKVTRELARIDTSAPIPLRAVVGPGGVREIEFQIEPKDDREAGRAVDALDTLVEIQAAGLFQDTLSFDHVEHVAVDVVLKDGGTRRLVPATGATRPSNVHARGARPAHPIVTWDHIIGPDESEEIVRKLAHYPEVAAYKAGRSYRERDISVIEMTLPAAGELVSLAKATTFKPTIYLVGRQHANEVSSTSHTLRLAELVVTDPSYRDILKKVNLVIQPVENPDGAEMAYALQKLTPTHMLHAGRYSAVGSDVGSGTVGEWPLPESLVRGRLWRDWLPDIYLNLHGYPSHEWVQPFAGYVPPGFRSYLLSRGWYTQISGLRDPRYPAFGTFTDAIREAIVREINQHPDVRALNLRHQARYRRWAYGFQPHVNPEEVYRDTMFYFTNPETGEPTGSRRAPVPSAPRPGSRPTMGSWPHVTYLNSGVSEAPDETAQGDWLALVAKPGLSFVMASVKYLRDGRYEVLRIDEDAASDGASRTLLRVRPVLPAVERTGTRQE